MNTSHWPKAFADFAKKVEFDAAQRAAFIANWKATKGMETGRRLFWQMQHQGWFDGESRMGMTPETAEAVTAYAASIGVKLGQQVRDKWEQRFGKGSTIRLVSETHRGVHLGVDEVDAPNWPGRNKVSDAALGVLEDRAASEWQLTNEIPEGVERVYVGFDTAQGSTEDARPRAELRIEIRTEYNFWGHTR